MFVTAWMGVLDLETGALQFANAGHNPPLLKRADGEFEYLRSRAGFVLAGMEGVKYRINQLTLSAGDRLFLYTDGVTEATNMEKQLTIVQIFHLCSIIQNLYQLQILTGYQIN